MSVDDHKEFEIQHFFEDVMRIDQEIRGREEEHFGVSWQLRVSSADGWLTLYLDCLNFDEKCDWKIETSIEVYLNHQRYTTANIHVYGRCTTRNLVCLVGPNTFNRISHNGGLTIKMYVQIMNMKGIETNKKEENRKLRIFDDESAKELSDVALVVKDQKFHVNKMYLAAHSTYFKSLLLGKFQETAKSEVELMDIDPNDFQKFLETLYGEPVSDENAVKGILKLADMFDSKTVFRQCEKFLIYESKQPLKTKFALAIQYKMENLKTKIISDMKTIDDFRTIVPEDNVEFGDAVWKELYMKLLSHCK